MKKLFETPEVQVVVFGIEDIITTSGIEPTTTPTAPDFVPGENELPGDSLI